MPDLKTRAFLHERRMKHVAPSAAKRADLPAALATKANDTMKRYPLEEREQIAEILRVLSAKPQQFRLQFLGAANATGATVQNETSIWAPDETAAVRMANDAPLAAEVTGIRVVDHEGCTVFER
jgi:2-C-methyl-D-erythritol 4-phosphate cytidylyltransferase